MCKKAVKPNFMVKPANDRKRENVAKKEKTTCLFATGVRTYSISNVDNIELCSVTHTPKKKSSIELNLCNPICINVHQLKFKCIIQHGMKKYVRAGAHTHLPICLYTPLTSTQKQLSSRDSCVYISFVIHRNLSLFHFP